MKIKYLGQQIVAIVFGIYFGPMLLAFGYIRNIS